MKRVRVACTAGVFAVVFGVAAGSVAQPSGRTLPAGFAEIADYKAGAFLNDLSARRRTNSLFVNRQSPRDGVQENHVNTSRGNLTFLVRDLVRRAGMPIVFGRVYDSSHAEDGDFGPGWKLAVREEIVHVGGEYVLTDAANAHYRFTAAHGGLAPRRSGLTSILSGRLEPATAGGVARATLRSPALVRRFDLLGDKYRLVGVEHRDGELSITYSGDRIASIASGSARVDIVRRADGRIVSAHDDKGRTVFYGYDDGGRRRLADGLRRCFGPAREPERPTLGDRARCDLRRQQSVDRARIVDVVFVRVHGGCHQVGGRTVADHDVPARGRPDRGVVAPSGMFAQAAFNHDLRPVSVIRDGLVEARMSYDTEGRLATVAGPDGTSAYAYGAYGLACSRDVTATTAAAA